LNQTSIGVIGLGRLGLPVASLLSRYYPTVGLDIDQAKIDSLNKGTFTTSEPNCTTSGAAYYTTDYDSLVSSSDIVVVCVNTPTDANGNMDSTQLKECFKSLDKALASTSKNIKILVLSTLMPEHGEWLASFFSERKWPPQIVINPVWIAIGSVIKDLQNPPMQVYGGDSDKPILWAIKLWADIPSVEYHTPIITDTRTASFLKLAHNAWCTMKMSFIGELGDKAAQLGIDINTTSEFFRRGGERPGAFWQYGPSFGGPCFPRDLDFFNQFTDSGLGRRVQLINFSRLHNIAAQVKSKNTVLIVGKTYKEGVDITESSISLKLEQLLLKKSCVVDFLDEDLNELPGSDVSAYDTVIVLHRGYDRLISEARETSNLQVIDLWSTKE